MAAASSLLAAAATREESHSVVDAAPKRPTQLLPLSTADGAAASLQQASPSTPTSAQTPTPTSPSCPEMPQWKKDLIQRRKSNVARTITAADALASPTKDATAATPTKPNASQLSATTPTTPTTAANNENSPKKPANRNSPLCAGTPQSPTSVRCIGGHYTPSNTSNNNTTNNNSNNNSGNEGMLPVDDVERNEASEMEQRSPTKATTDAPIPKQRSLNASAAATTATTTAGGGMVAMASSTFSLPSTARSQSKEPLAPPTDGGGGGSSNTSESRSHTTTTTKTATTTRLTSFRPAAAQAEGSGSEMAINRIQSTATPSPPSMSGARAQLYLKTESERSQTGVGELAKTTASAYNETAATKTAAKVIANKLQNNQFIKNQLQQQQQQQQQLQQQQQCKYPGKLQTNTAACATGSPPPACGNGKKMVAMQEMKKTTTTCGRQGSNHSQREPMEDAYDSGEDLSYGPGIVSKLRCRYLSLALRESMEKERHCLDTMRRATSLNNLLDERKDDVEDDEEVGPPATNSVNKVLQQLQEDSAMRTKAGILKTPSGEDQALLQASTKKQTTFQKHNSNGSQAATNGVARLTQSQHSSAPTEGVSPNVSDAANRSRHVKRGNDSLKRARSVEALLCIERTPWNRNSYEHTTAPSSGVTIEDKINNARERLLSGADTLPPKRLTSIIDDTERPPPDLVKQTLKKFEATANRRGRGPCRTNGKGEVATKVANYRTIIKENKPAIVFPKPASPTKKLICGPVGKPSAKPIVGTSDLLGSPVGRKTQAAFDAPHSPVHAAKPRSTVAATAAALLANSSGGGGGGGVLSEQTPDVIPRYGGVKLSTEAIVDSPVTALTKKLEKLRIDASAAGDGKESQLKLEGNNNTKMHERNNDSDAFVGGDGTSVAGSDAGSGSGDDKRDRSDRYGKGTGNDSESSSDCSDEEGGRTRRVTKTALENIARAGTTQQFKFATTTTTAPTTTAVAAAAGSIVNGNNSESPSHVAALPTSSMLMNVAGGKQIGVIRPLHTTTGPATSTPTSSPINTQQQQQQQHLESLKLKSVPPYLPHTPPTTLTSREIEKNRINELRKTAPPLPELTAGGNHSSSGASSPTTSLDTVINTRATANIAGITEMDAMSPQGPLWALRKKRSQQANSADNPASMVFNFSNRAEVPDYIENDGVIFRPKRELPKPNESGFVLLGDLSLETSTDSDYDEFSMCPPSPCDVEFENANIVIDGKSSIRQKSKEATFRVQFNDSLTSTFEYPSEASLSVNETFHERFANLERHRNHDTEDLVRAYENLVLDDADSPKHHHVAVDEIIPLPINAGSNEVATTNPPTPTKNILGNLPLGSAPLNFYTPVKAPIENLFELGVTRAPHTNGHSPPNAAATTTATTNGQKQNGGESNGRIVSLKNGSNDVRGTNGDGDDEGVGEEPESLQYIKPANDDLTIAYSEGTQKTDLLY